MKIYLTAESIKLIPEMVFLSQRNVRDMLY